MLQKKRTRLVELLGDNPHVLAAACSLSAAVRSSVQYRKEVSAARAYASTFNLGEQFDVALKYEHARAMAFPKPAVSPMEVAKTIFRIYGDEDRERSE